MKRARVKGIGFAVYSGRMTSTGSAGAMYPGDFNPEVLAPYRSTSGIGRAHPDNEPEAERQS